MVGPRAKNLASLISGSAVGGLLAYMAVISSAKRSSASTVAEKERFLDSTRRVTGVVSQSK